MKNDSVVKPLHADEHSPWSPLRQRIFRALWIATIVSNLGTWMQNVGASWLMTALSPSPLIIAMVQAATSLPAFLLALPAGALADITDRRRLLLITQFWMLAAAAVLSAATYAGAMNPGLLLLLTFILGIGAAMNGPAWQAIVGDLVGTHQLSAAVSLNSAAFNLARAVGPALAGLILARAGAGTVFLLNALSFIGVLFVLYRWKSTRRGSVLPAERFVGAMRAGIRYVHHAPAVHAVLVRTAAFILFGSAIWALLPLVVKTGMGRGPSTYGVLLGGLGAGALIGATLLPRLKSRASLDIRIIGASVVFAIATIGSGIIRNYAVMIMLMLLGGAAWIVVLSSLNVAARMVVPAWVQARSLAFYLLVFQGGTTVGSLVWGAFAGRLGVNSTLVAAGIGLIISLAAAFLFPLRGGESLDLTPAVHWPEPGLVAESAADNGPAFVTVEYQVDPRNAEEFVRRMADMQRIRRRDGALQWGLFVDATDQWRYLEEFLVESWLEHLRQHERITVSDREVQEWVRSLHVGPEPPRVSHYVSAGHPEGNAAAKKEVAMTNDRGAF
jgi:MFS family permease